MFDPRVSFPSPPDGGDVVEVRWGRADAVRRLAVAVGGLDALVGLDAGADDEWGWLAGDSGVGCGEVGRVDDRPGDDDVAPGGEAGGGAVGSEDGDGVEAPGRAVPDAGGRDPMAWVWSPAVGAPDEFVLAGLAQVDVSLLTESELVAHVARLHQVQAYVESLQVTALAVLAGAQEQASVVPLPGKGTVVVADVIREEVATALGLGLEAAQGRITAARVLSTLLPGTRAALGAGRVSGAHARVMADAVRTGAGSLILDGEPVDPDSDLGRDAVALLAAGLEERALPRAQGSVGAFRATVARVLAALDPAGAAERARRARKTRDVVVRHDGEGVSTLIATLATEHALAIEAALDTAVADLTCHASVDPAGVGPAGSGPAGGHHHAPADHAGVPESEHVHDQGCEPGCELGPCQACAGLTAGEARAEALTALVLAGRAPLAADPGRRDARPGAEINLVIDLTTLLGLDDRPAATWEGIGVPAAAARDLAADATLRRLITDPQTGQLLDYGTTTYHVPEPLARFVKARDRVCGFPQCTRRATRRGPATTGRGIDLDHLEPYHQHRTATAGGGGGGTDRANLGPRCRRHHILKTHLDWHTTAPPEGTTDRTTRWRSPHGRHHDVRPDPLIEPLGQPPGAPPSLPPLPPLPAGWPGTRDAIILDPDPPF